MIDYNDYIGKVVCGTLLSGQRVIGMIALNDNQEYILADGMEAFITEDGVQMIPWQPFTDDNSALIFPDTFSSIAPKIQNDLKSYWMKMTDRPEIVLPEEKRIIM